MFRGHEHGYLKCHSSPAGGVIVLRPRIHVDGVSKLKRLIRGFKGLRPQRFCCGRGLCAVLLLSSRQSHIIFNLVRRKLVFGGKVGSRHQAPFWRLPELASPDSQVMSRAPEGSSSLANIVGCPKSFTKVVQKGDFGIPGGQII